MSSGSSIILVLLLVGVNSHVYLSPFDFLKFENAKIQLGQEEPEQLHFTLQTIHVLFCLNFFGLFLLFA